MADIALRPPSADETTYVPEPRLCSSPGCGRRVRSELWAVCQSCLDALFAPAPVPKVRR